MAAPAVTGSRAPSWASAGIAVASMAVRPRVRASRRASSWLPSRKSTSRAVVTTRFGPRQRAPGEAGRRVRRTEQGTGAALEAMKRSITARRPGFTGWQTRLATPKA
jgi:hypothetical protein